MRLLSSSFCLSSSCRSTSRRHQREARGIVQGLEAVMLLLRYSASRALGIRFNSILFGTSFRTTTYPFASPATRKQAKRRRERHKISNGKGRLARPLRCLQLSLFTSIFSTGFVPIILYQTAVSLKNVIFAQSIGQASVDRGVF